MWVCAWVVVQSLLVFALVRLCLVMRLRWSLLWEVLWSGHFDRSYVFP